MGVAIAAPRGGLAETLAGARRVLILGNGEIERFEDQHTGIFTIWAGFQGRGDEPTATRVRDLVALGLIGGGMADLDADALVAGLGPDHNPALFQIAHALVGVAFYPDAPSDGGDDPEDLPAPDPEAEADPAKKP